VRCRGGTAFLHARVAADTGIGAVSASERNFVTSLASYLLSSDIHSEIFAKAPFIADRLVTLKIPRSSASRYAYKTLARLDLRIP